MQHESWFLKVGSSCPLWGRQGNLGGLIFSDSKEAMRKEGNAAISWSLYPKWPPTTTSPTSPKQWFDNGSNDNLDNDLDNDLDSGYTQVMACSQISSFQPLLPVIARGDVRPDKPLLSPSSISLTFSGKLVRPDFQQDLINFGTASRYIASSSMQPSWSWAPLHTLMLLCFLSPLTCWYILFSMHFIGSGTFVWS